MICEFHHIQIDYDFLEIKKENLSIIHYDLKSLLCFSIDDICWQYEYIYQYDTHILCLTIKKHISNHQESKIGFIDYLIEHDGFMKHSLYTYNQPLFITRDNYQDFMHCIHTQDIPLPIVYLNPYWIKKYKSLYHQIYEMLKGIALIVCCENKKIDRDIHNGLNLPLGSYFIFSNHDMQKIQYRFLNNEKMFSLIFQKMKDYVTKVEYDISIEQIHLEFLEHMNHNEKMKEKDILSSLDDEMNLLDYKINDISEKITDLEKDLLALESENNYLLSLVHSHDYYPVLIKGDEKEFYDGEQKDMILYLLEKELKNPSREASDIKIIKHILDKNDKVGIRDIYLDEIKKIFWPMSSLNEASISKLRKYGIIIKKGRTHYDCKFFNDPRYPIPPASTPSDMNAFHEIFREIKNFFF